MAILCMFMAGGSLRYYFMQNDKRSQALITPEQQAGYTRSLVELIGDNVTIIKSECGKYPDSLDELVGDGFCSKTCPQVECLKSEDLKDAWGRPLEYFRDSERLTIRSRGRDGREGGVAEDQDFVQILPMKDE